jgi:putative ABC transport system permease protein
VEGWARKVWESPVRINDLLRVSVRQVFRQRRRNFAVALAMSLGIAGIIAIVTMGNDVRSKFSEDLELLGGATIIKARFDTYHQGKPVSLANRFVSRTLEAIRRLEEVRGASLMVFRGGVRSSMRERRHAFNVVGVDEFFWDVHSFAPLRGRFFGAEEVTQHRKVCVLGEELATTIFGDSEAVGKRLLFDQEFFEIIGIVGGPTLGERGNFAFVPITAASDRMRHLSAPDKIYVRVRTWDDVEKVASAIPRLVEASQRAEGLVVEVEWDRLKQVKRVAFMIELFVHLAVIATLILGGFGIWNISIMAVRARTREIGLKKAMGARDGDIFSQFLTEVLCLSLGSGILGVAMGRAAVEIASSMLSRRPPEELFLHCVGLGLLLAVLLGVAAGLYPSIQASRMEVAAAIRYE